MELWFSPCVWSLCFSSIADGHNTPVAQVRQSSVYWLLGQHYYVPGLCGGIFLFSWGQCRGNEYSVSTNCLLSVNLEYSSITEYMVYYYCEHQILFKGTQYFSSFLVLLVWFSPLWNFFFSTYFMLSHCMQNSWIVLEPCSVEHRIAGQQQVLHVTL